MREDVSCDFQWGRKYLPAIKRILGLHLIAEAPQEEDCQRATDLMVLRLDTVRVACRVRRSNYLTLRYVNQFTIRSDRPSGAETELAKILAGWGDYIFYGFAESGSGRKLAAWLLGDLRIFRLWFQRKQFGMKVNTMPGESCSNSDGTKFRAFNIVDMPQGFIVARERNEIDKATALVT